jgi:hypothetical protein
MQANVGDKGEEPHKLAQFWNCGRPAGHCPSLEVVRSNVRIANARRAHRAGAKAPREGSCADLAKHR